MTTKRKRSSLRVPETHTVAEAGYKKRVRELLAAGRYEEIADLAEKRKRILGTLLSLTFDEDPLIPWLAVEAMGAAAERIADTAPKAVLSHLRRLHWLISEESGGVCWYAPQAMAEIVRRKPDVFGDYIPIIVTLIAEMAEEDLEHFRPGVLWAIGRLAPVAAKEIDNVLSRIVACLGSHDPRARGLAVWCLAQAGHAAHVKTRGELLSDEGELELFGEGRLNRTTVAELARQAIGA